MESNSPVLPEFYQARAELHREVCRKLERQSRLLSNMRGLAFAAWTLGWGFALFGSAGSLGAVIGSVALLVFVAMVFYHPKVINAESREARWVATNEDAAARVSPQAWHDLAANGEQFRDASHPYADDLDLFGRASLFQRLCVAKTHLGQAQLAEFLLAPAKPSEIRIRQDAIRAFSTELELRQELEVLARATLTPARRGESQTAAQDLEPLFAWGESTPEFASQPWLMWLARGLPLVTTILLTASSLHLVPSWLGFCSLAAHVAVLITSRRASAAVVSMLSTSEQTVLQVEPLFALLEGQPREGALRQLLDAGLKSTGTNPSTACRSLRRIAGWFEFRHNGLVYPFVNLYVLWDLQCALAFDAWRHQHGKQLRRWFALLGEVEALSSLAGLHHDEPQSSFAEIVDTGSIFEAQALGHPLIEREHRVCNDVSPLHAGHGLLVTGSNMSGKSTFLRAIGLGAVLGLAGGPVCAKHLRLSPMAVATSMRISDSLASGVSHFYAELRKLKAVVDASSGSRPLLFLLDEILHGTNSRERRIGARWILTQLLQADAMGAVSTHDLALCELHGELAHRLRLVHFRENVEGETMTFDYALREGAVTEGNALRLMRSLGLAVPLDDTSNT